MLDVRKRWEEEHLGTNYIDINIVHTNQKIIIKVSLLLINIPISKCSIILSIYILYNKQILIKFIQRHIHNDIKIADRRIRKYIKPPFTTITS